jgi:hypothetical protein
MVENPFLQRPFPVSPSMNQVRIVDLPGLAVPEWVKGKRSFDLLSSFALGQRVQDVASQLQLDPNDPQLLEQFDACLTAVSPHIQMTAQTIAQDFGRSLAYLLLTLKRRDAVNQLARPDWQPHHWAFWQQIQTVWLGGGLLSGNLGQTAVSLARDLIQQAGFLEFQLHLAPNGRLLPLLGVARTASPGAAAMLLFDFGQTAVKRGIALYRDSQLIRLELLPSLPSPCQNARHASQDRVELAQFAAWLLDVLWEAWRETTVAYPNLSSTIAVSLACYLLAGQPRPEDVGCYGRLQHLTPNLNQFLNDGFSQRLGQSATVNLWHDGAAAGLSQAGAKQTAVLTFGTAIGVGFPPLDGSFCAVNPALIIQPSV